MRPNALIPMILRSIPDFWGGQRYSFRAQVLYLLGQQRIRQEKDDEQDHVTT